MWSRHLPLRSRQVILASILVLLAAIPIRIQSQWRRLRDALEEPVKFTHYDTYASRNGRTVTGQLTVDLTEASRGSSLSVVPGSVQFIREGTLLRASASVRQEIRFGSVVFYSRTVAIHSEGPNF